MQNVFFGSCSVKGTSSTGAVLIPKNTPYPSGTGAIIKFSSMLNVFVGTISVQGSTKDVISYIYHKLSERTEESPSSMTPPELFNFGVLSWARIP